MSRNAKAYKFKCALLQKEEACRAKTLCFSYHVIISPDLNSSLTDKGTEQPSPHKEYFSDNSFDMNFLCICSRNLQSSAEKGGIRIEYAKTKMGEVHE